MEQSSLSCAFWNGARTRYVGGNGMTGAKFGREYMTSVTHIPDRRGHEDNIMPGIICYFCFLFCYFLSLACRRAAMGSPLSTAFVRNVFCETFH